MQSGELPIFLVLIIVCIMLTIFIPGCKNGSNNTDSQMEARAKEIAEYLHQTYEITKSEGAYIIQGKPPGKSVSLKIEDGNIVLTAVVMEVVEKESDEEYFIRVTYHVVVEAEVSIEFLITKIEDLFAKFQNEDPAE